ncbi:MAG: PAS domain S-box protein [Bryobacteraceae bacterium]
MQTLFHKHVDPGSRPEGLTPPDHPVHRPGDPSGPSLFLPFAVFLVLATGLAGASYWYFLHERDAFLHEIGNQLSAIADMKVSQVTAWREERFKDARAIMAAAALPSAVHSLEGTDDAAAIAIVRQWMQHSKAAVYANAVLVDRQGRTRVAFGVAGSPELYARLSEQARQAGGVVLADLPSDQRQEGIDLGLVIPLAAGASSPTATLVLGIDARKSLYPLIQPWPVPGGNGDILLLRREGASDLPLSDSRRRKDGAEPLPAGIALSAVAQAALERGATMKGQDYRGVPVLAAMRKVPATTWSVLAEMDLEEAELPLRGQSAVLALRVAALIAAAGFGLGVLWRHQRLRFYKQAYESEVERRALVGHFDYLSHYANDIILLANTEGCIIEANQRASAAYGYSREDLLRKRLGDLWQLHTAESESQPPAEIEADARVIETWHRRQDGTVFPVEASTRTIDVDGVKFLQTIVRDITERKTMEEELRQAKQRLEAVIQAAPAGIVVLDRKGLIQLWNKAAERIYGWTAQEVVGQHVPDAMYSEEDRAGGRQLWKQQLAGKALSAIEATRLRKDGSPIEVSVSSAPLFDGSGSAVGILVVISDITDRKKTEESLIESEERFRLAVETAPEAIFIQTGGCIRYVNPAAVAAFGAESADQLLARPVLERIHPDCHALVRERIRELREEKRRVPAAQEKYVKLDGSVIDVEVSAEPFRYLNADGALVFFREVTERKRAEEALRESERRLQLAVQVSKTGLWDYDLRSKEVYYSPEWKAQLGYAPGEIGNTLDEWENRLHPEDRERAMAVIRSLDAASPEFEADFRLRHKDGSYRWILARGALLFDAQGQPRRVIGSHMDFTERKKMEEELDASRRLVHRILNATPDLLYIYDLAEGRNTFANRHVTEFLGYSFERAQALGADLMGQILHPEDAPAVAQHLRRCRAAADGETLEIEYRMRHADGHWCWVHCRDMVFSRTDGIPSKVLGVAQDVTERKHTEDALRKSEARLERAQRIAELGSWEATTQSLETESATEPCRWSNELYRIWGVSKESFAPTPKAIAATIPAEDCEAVLAAVRATIETGKAFRVDHRIIRPDGTQRWVRQHGELETDDSGNQRMIATAQDVTEYRRLQDQFLQAQRLESIGRLAGGVAHDFNNLLTVIICCGELVLEELPADGFLATSVGEIRKAAQRAAALTEQLLAFGRRQVVQPKVLDLNLVILDVEKMIGRLIGEDIELMVRLEAAGKVVADPNQINQVLMNLAVNARDAMPRGGKLIIETSDFNAGESRPELAGGSYVELAVGDTGSGMDEYTRSHLFEPFFTTKEKAKGTGLGLSTVYGIVKQAGGHIWVRSEPGAGTTFHICLPRAEGEVVAAEVSKTPAADLRGDETLLVVEDQAEVRHLAMEVLESYGYKVLGAASGVDALQLCEIYTGPIQMMVTDVVMPGMTGPELAAKLTELRPQIKVLFMSGYADKLIAGEGELAGNMAYLQKPFSPRSLAAKVREALGPLASKSE